MFCQNCGIKTNQELQSCLGCGALLSRRTNSVPIAEKKEFSEEYAGFWYRVLAYAIDWILSTVLVIILALPMGFVLGASMADTASSAEMSNMGETLGKILAFFIVWLWFTIPESSKWQATIGKKLLGLRVTDEFGERISFGRANGRYWSKIISAIILGIGFLMVAFTEKKQGLHDKNARTLVIKTCS